MLVGILILSAFIPRVLLIQVPLILVYKVINCRQRPNDFNLRLFTKPLTAFIKYKEACLQDSKRTFNYIPQRRIAEVKQLILILWPYIYFSLFFQIILNFLIWYQQHRIIHRIPSVGQIVTSQQSIKALILYKSEHSAVIGRAFPSGQYIHEVYVKIARR